MGMSNSVGRLRKAVNIPILLVLGIVYVIGLSLQTVWQCVQEGAKNSTGAQSQRTESIETRNSSWASQND